MSIHTDRLFRDYAFASTATVSGTNFDRFTFDEDTRKYVKNSNFAFATDKVRISVLDDMFNGCVNAMFTNALNLTSEHHVSSDRMFKDCVLAKIPSVSFDGSALASTESMFENCYSAVLDGVFVPSSSENYRNMFKNCSNALFDDIGGIPYTSESLSGVFSGCRNGTFFKFDFAQDAANLPLHAPYNCDYMFYDCEKLNSTSFDFDKLAPYLGSAEKMFYNAGFGGSSSFNNQILRFMNLGETNGMFEKSRFSFENVCIQMFGSGSEGIDGPNGEQWHPQNTVTSVSRWFAGNGSMKGSAPKIILSDSNTMTSFSAIEEQLAVPLSGHYGSGDSERPVRGILDFGELYADSSIRSADIRGISNNFRLDGLGGAVQNFSAVFRGCSNLTELYGHLPSHSYTYASLFDGCGKLVVDLSRLFRKIEGKSIVPDYSEDGLMETYSMTSIGRMANGCKDVVSTDDAFDLSNLVKTVCRNLTGVGEEPQYNEDSFNFAFPPIRIATKTPHPQLAQVSYGLGDVSRKLGIVRFNSFADEPIESGKGGASEFGIYSNYARWVFKGGFYRFGGYFQNEPNRYFCLIYYPSVNTDGTVTEFGLRRIGDAVGLRPSGFETQYGTDSSQQVWNEAVPDGYLYAAAIYDVDGGFVKNAFVGKYVRIQHKFDPSTQQYVSSRFSYPVTYFEGQPNETIRSLR